MNKYEEESINTQTEGEPEETQTEEESDNTQPELTREQKSKLDSFDRIYAENKELKEKLKVPEVKEESKVTQEQPEDLDKILDQKLQKALDEKELENVELSDDGKSELKNYAKTRNILVREAIKSDYFNFLKGKEVAAQKAEEASAGGKRRASGKKDFSSSSPKDFDLSTEEGQKEYEEFKEWRKQNM